MNAQFFEERRNAAMAERDQVLIRLGILNGTILNCDEALKELANPTPEEPVQLTLVESKDATS